MLPLPEELTTIRKLQAHNKVFHLSIPLNFLRFLRWEKGEALRIKLDVEGKKIEIINEKDYWL